MASFDEGLHLGIVDGETWRGLGPLLIKSLGSRDGIFAADSLITFSKSLGFLSDAPLMEAWRRHAETRAERAILWRTLTLVWAARRGVKGAYVECGCYKGTTARILIDAVNWTQPVFLYDLFEHDASMDHHGMAEHGEGLFERVKARFPEPFVTVTQGKVPDCLGNAPDEIALLHIDMNSVHAEIGALERLFDRVVPGGAIIFDDYGWGPYKAQHDAELAWLAARGTPILEMPTGQGLVIKL